MGNRRFEHRAGICTLWATMALGSVLLAGCATSPWPWSHSSPAKPASSDAKATSPSPPKSSGSQADAETLKQVMAELQQVGALDPVAQDKLLADLKQVDPSLWPMVLQTFRAEAAYKRREEQREAERKKEESTAANTPREGADAITPVAAEQETRFELKTPLPPEMLTQASEGSNKPSPPAPLPEGEGSKSPSPNAHLPITGQGSRSSSAPAPLPEGEGSKKPSPPDPLPRTGEGRTTALPSDQALAPLPSSLSLVYMDRPALSPEPPLAGGIDTSTTAAGFATAKPGEASALPPPLLSTAERLAATRNEASASAVVPAGTTATAAGAPLSEADWKNHLTEAIRSIELESKAGSKSESDIALQARLRMLYLLAGRRDDAMRPLPAAAPAAQDYWSSQIYGLSTWMDAEKTPDSGRRAAETKRILGEALAQLGETAPLAVRNLTFCTEIFRFGSFEAMKSTEFTPGQKVLIYAEVDNLHIESSTKGYHWAVKIDGQIFDSRGNRMTDYGPTSAEETYQTPRHDFFVSKLYYLPRLVPGRYTLQLTIEDTLGHKVGQSSIDFTVRPK